jgi:hypothetical protein
MNRTVGTLLVEARFRRQQSMGVGDFLWWLCLDERGIAWLFATATICLVMNFDFITFFLKNL